MSAMTHFQLQNYYIFRRQQVKLIHVQMCIVEMEAVALWEMMTSLPPAHARWGGQEVTVPKVSCIVGTY